MEWLIEFGAVNTMKRAGFPMERFKFGDTVSVTGYPGRRDRAVLLRLGLLAAARGTRHQRVRRAVLGRRRLGLDWPALRGVNPKLIHVSITAFGRRMAALLPHLAILTRMGLTLLV